MANKKTPAGGTVVKSEAQQAQDKEAALAAKAKKFSTLAGKRVNAALTKINLIGNLANRSSYHYTGEQIGKIEKAINAAHDAVLLKFKAALEGKAASKGETFEV
jgi:hypothetical protein